MNKFSLSKQDTAVLKGIAIVAMLFHHLYFSIPQWVEPYTGVWLYLGVAGKICVAIFLFCSGYGLEAQYKGFAGFGHSFRFVIKRLTSFYFNYWIIFLLFVPVTILFFNRPLSAAYGEGLSSLEMTLYFIQDIIGLAGLHSYNITWWFNFLIVIFYLIFPFVSWLARKSSVFTLVLSIAVMVFLKSEYNINAYQFAFVLGILWSKAASVAQHSTSHIVIKYVLPSILSTGVMLAVRICFLPRDWSVVKMDFLILLSILLMLVIVLFVIVFVRKSEITMSVFSFLGRHATNIYLMHTFVNAYWQFHWLHKGVFMRNGGNFIVLLTICMGFSMLLEYVKNKIGFYKLLDQIKTRLS